MRARRCVTHWLPLSPSPLVFYNLPKLQHTSGIFNLSEDPRTSIDSLIKIANDHLKHWAETEPKVELNLGSVGLWVLIPTVLEAMELQTEVKDISQIKPGCRVNIEVELNFAEVVYRMIIKTLVNQSGALQLTHTEITDIQFPYSEKRDLWEVTKDFANNNQLALAGLMLSIFNASVNVLRLMGKA